MDEYLNDPTRITLSGSDAHGEQFKPMTGFDKVCAVFAIPLVSRASCPRFEGGTPATPKGPVHPSPDSRRASVFPGLGNVDPADKILENQQQPPHDSKAVMIYAFC